jgi:hypothetical protein
MAIKYTNPVVPDLIRHPVLFWIPASAGMTSFEYLLAALIKSPLAPLCERGEFKAPLY